MQILDGKKVSEKIVEDLTREVFLIKKNIERIPRLDVILVGDDFAGESSCGAEFVQTVEFGCIQFEFRALDEKSEPIEREDAREPPVFKFPADPVAAAPCDE